MSAFIYLADTIPLLKFSYMPDWQGDVLPPEAYCYELGEVPVYSTIDPKSSVVAKAYVYRIDNRLFAGIEFQPAGMLFDDVLALVGKLYVVPDIEVVDRCSSIITHIKIRRLYLTETKPLNDEAVPLGARLWWKNKADDVN